MGTLTDEEAITLCMLRGESPRKYAELCWYIRGEYLGRPVDQHEVEIAWSRDPKSGGRFYWASAEEAAQFYCKFYSLSLEENCHADATQKIVFNGCLGFGC